MATYITIDNLTRYDGNLKRYIDSDKTKSIKSVGFKDNKINFYTVPTPTDETLPNFTVDMPVEYFLDQTKTTLIDDFAWSEELYPGSTDPLYEGDPVLVLAVKGDNDTVSYSFLDLKAVVKIYEAGSTSGIEIKIDAETNIITANLKLSAEQGNILSLKEDGLYAESVMDISSKADKLTASMKAGQILVDDGMGNISASNKTIEELSNDILDLFVPLTNEQIDALFSN